MKAKLFSLVLSMAFVVTVSAQSDYRNSVGLRLGVNPYYDTFGATFKTFISEPAALQFDLGIKPSYRIAGYAYDVTRVSLSGAYQHHFPIANVDGLKWFVGGGAVIANSFSDFDGHKGLAAGLFASGGADYKLKNAPFAFSAEIRPTAHLVRPDHGIPSFVPNGGVTARYTF